MIQEEEEESFPFLQSHPFPFIWLKCLKEHLFTGVKI